MADMWGAPSPPGENSGDNSQPTSHEDRKEIKVLDAAANNARAQATNWGKPVAYNYESSTGATREERDKAATEANQKHLEELRAKSAGDRFVADVPLWASSAVKYEWKDEYGDIGPRVPELERMLYNDQFLQRAGEKFAEMTMESIEVTVESESKINPVLKWEDAGLHPVMMENVRLCGYSTPTAIQCYCVPAVLSNHDVIAVAQTGSGKTAAYLVPTLSKLMGKAKKLAARRPGPDNFDPALDGVRAEPLILIIVPTRELAVQIFDESRRLCYRSMLRPCVAYGGAPRKEQILELKRGCDVLIATPGRLQDFIRDGALLTMSRVRYTIIDEADELVSPDWAEEMKNILTESDANQDADHRYLMFSATFARAARQLARAHLAEDYIRIRVGRLGSTHRNICQKIVWADEHVKQQCVFDLLVDMPPCRTIIFVNRRQQADLLDDFLYNHGMPSTSIHAERTQREREDSLRSFRSGKAPILVATGLSARGLDIWNVMHVINYDLPSETHGGIHEYVHRIGRTARIGNEGTATSLFNERNEDIAEQLVNILLESGQEVPDFLERYRPEGDKLDFHDDSGEEDLANTADGSGLAFGSAGNANTDGDMWGSGPAPSANGDSWAKGDANEPDPNNHADTAADNTPSDGW